MQVLCFCPYAFILMLPTHRVKDWSAWTRSSVYLVLWGPSCCYSQIWGVEGGYALFWAPGFRFQPSKERPELETLLNQLDSLKGGAGRLSLFINSVWHNSGYIQLWLLATVDLDTTDKRAGHLYELFRLWQRKLCRRTIEEPKAATSTSQFLLLQRSASVRCALHTLCGSSVITVFFCMRWAFHWGTGAGGEGGSSGHARVLVSRTMWLCSRERPYWRRTSDDTVCA